MTSVQGLGASDAPQGAIAKAVPVSRLGRDGGVSLGISMAIQGLNVISGVLLARSLGPAGRGVLAAVILWPSVLSTVFCAGLNEAVTYFTSRFREQARQIAATGFAVALAESI